MMINRRLFRCHNCGMIYWGHELLSGYRWFPITLRVKCPTPGCQSWRLYGQTSPFEAGLFDGLKWIVVALIFFAIFIGFNLYSVAGVAALGSLITFISYFRHKPNDPSEDQIFSAEQVMEQGERLYQNGKLERARYAFARAATLLGNSVNLELEGAIIGRLANSEKDLGDFASARTHYEVALKIAQNRKDVSGEINRLNNIAALLGDDLRNPLEALPFIERAVALARNYGDPIKLCLMLCHLAKRHRESDHLEQAQTSISEAYELAQRVSQAEILAEVLGERAFIATVGDRKQDAVHDLKQALALLTQEDRRGLHKVFTENLSALEASIRANEPLQITSPAQQFADDDVSGLFIKLNSQARAALQPAMEHSQAGRLQLAAEHFRQALQQTCVSNDPLAYALAGMNLGDILCDLGKVNEAVAILHNALTKAQEVNNAYLQSGIFLNLGLALRAKGSWAEGKQCLERALSLTKQEKNLSAQGRVYMALGNLYRESHEFQLAEEQYEQAEKCALATNDKRLQGSVLVSWGNLYFRRRQWENAMIYYDKARAVAKLIRDGRLQGIICHMLGSVYRRLGRLEQALPELQQSITIEGASPSEVGLAGRLNDLAVVEGELGHYVEARDHYKKAANIYRKLSIASAEVAGVLENVGVFLIRMGEVTEGRDHMLDASNMDNVVIPQAFAIASENARLQFLRLAETRLYDLISLIAKGGPFEIDTETIKACADVLIRRKGVTLETLAVQRDLVACGEYPELADVIEELTQVRMYIAKLILAGRGQKQDSTLSEEAANLYSRKKKLEQQVSQYLPVVDLDERIRRADRQTVAQCLPNGSVLVEFLRFQFFDFPSFDRWAGWSPARYIAMILPSEKAEEVQMIDLGDAQKIEHLINQFRATITNEAEYEKVGFELKAAVFDPLLSAIRGYKKIFFASDGDLNRLPFETLPLSNGRHLIDEYYISYLSSSRDLLSLTSKSNRESSKPLVIADPDFDLGYSNDLSNPPKQQEQYKRLKGTNEEGKQIADKLGIQPWLGEAALEGKLKSYRSPSILHIATHGFFREDPKYDTRKELHKLDFTEWLNLDNTDHPERVEMQNPLLRSGLVLAGANTASKGRAVPLEAEDGILTAEDVTGLNLLGTELVVLSACETGLGEARTGEGVFGLRRAFILAGAKTLIISLWKVPDEQTKELMVEFYDHILAGYSRAESLRLAQLAIKKKYPHPFFWGAFICQGKPNPLPEHFIAKPTLAS